MASLTIQSDVRHGKLSDIARNSLVRMLAALEGKKIEISLGEAKKKRSLPQNAFFHGIVLPMVWGELFIKNGNIFSLEDVKEYLKGEVGQLYKNIITPDGEIRKVLRSTTDLTTMEWENWLEGIRAWAAGYDLQLPLPNEDLSQYNDNLNRF